MKTEQNNKNAANKNFYLRHFCCFVFLFIIDRFSKLFFINKSDYFKNFYLFQLSLSINKNIAFGIAIPQVVIFFLIFLILTFLFYLLVKHLKKNNAKFAAFVNLIIIGALSNLLDRIKFNGVVDFIYIPHFTIFNLADLYITVGVILWLLAEKKRKSA